jgi:hypothetical protein
MSFWNDLLRNDDGTSALETNGRKSITPAALVTADQYAA